MLSGVLDIDDDADGLCDSDIVAIVADGGDLLFELLETESDKVGDGELEIEDDALVAGDTTVDEALKEGDGLPLKDMLREGDIVAEPSVREKEVNEML